MIPHKLPANDNFTTEPLHIVACAQCRTKAMQVTLEGDGVHFWCTSCQLDMTSGILELMEDSNAAG
jgi:hypothetical protein